MADVVNCAVSRLKAWSYHVFNLILHCITSTLVFVIVRDYLWWPAADRGRNGAGSPDGEVESRPSRGSVAS